jgi:hypothetical protein
VRALEALGMGGDYPRAGLSGELERPRVTLSRRAKQVPRSAITCSQLTTTPSLSLSWLRPISSNPDLSQTALISGLQAYTGS